MACSSMRTTPEQTLEQRIAEINAALKSLEQALLAGRVRLQIGSSGAVAFEGWNATDRRSISDACAFRTLSVNGSTALRQAVARAEMQQGRRVNLQAIAAGVHSHDGGRTWNKH